MRLFAAVSAGVLAAGTAGDLRLGIFWILLTGKIPSVEQFDLADPKCVETAKQCQMEWISDLKMGARPKSDSAQKSTEV
jgi:hypothetical protein